MTPSAQRAIPAVEKAVQALGPLELPRALVVDAVRGELAKIRAGASVPEPEEIMQRLRSVVSELRASRLQPVINATGIPLHTNFGRAPLSRSALDALAAVGAGYSNLEYDLASGARGGRGAYVERCLALLCEAEAVAVVNNCAAALVLIVRQATAVRREVIISRGELVQIGGGFRVPDILEASGARLREVGTTNRTTVEDYANALGEDSALILKVHRSNFHMEGFVEEASIEQLAALAQRAGLPLVQDLGSGAIADLSQLKGLEREPSPAEVLRRGATLVSFSGDKLFGGPQAGIIAGRADAVQALKRHPFFRALRCDKLALAALQATAESHLAGRAFEHVPALAMIATDPAQLRVRGEAIAASLADLPLSAEVVEAEVEAGAGTLPRSRLRSIAVALSVRGSLEQFAARLRSATPPVIGYIQADRLRLDLRTVFPAQDQALMAAIRNAATQQ